MIIRIVTTAVVVILAAVAAVVSYSHVLDVVTQHGQSGPVAYLVPLTVDGLLFAASLSLLDAIRRGLRRNVLAWVSLGTGITLTLAANVMHGLAFGAVGAVVAALPAVTLTLSFELLMSMIRRQAKPVPVADVEAAEVTAVEVERPETADIISHSDEPVFDWAAAAPEYVVEEIDEELKNRAASTFLGELILGKVPGIRPIKDALNVGQEKAQQVRAYLSTLATS